MTGPEGPTVEGGEATAVFLVVAEALGTLRPGKHAAIAGLVEVLASLSLASEMPCTTAHAIGGAIEQSVARQLQALASVEPAVAPPEPPPTQPEPVATPEGGPW